MDTQGYNVEGSEEINTCQNTTIRNNNDNQNIPKKRNNNGDTIRRNRKWKERNRIRGQHLAMEKKHSKNL